MVPHRTSAHRHALVPEPSGRAGQHDDDGALPRAVWLLLAAPELPPASVAPITDAIGGAYHPTGPRCHAGDADRRSDDGPTGTGQDRAGWDHADRCGVGHLRLWCRAASGLLTHSADRAGNHGHGHGLLHDATVRGGGADPGPTSDRSRFDADQRQPAGGRFDRDRTDVGAAHLPVQSQRNHRYCKESRTDPREWRRAGGGG
ncbi:Uncharacterised protein [Mycobacterium tuberculosis]|nr:Uncharacterised protein [Mycobacterium tuberculosis]